MEKNLRKELKLYFESKAKVIQVVTSENLKIIGDLKNISKEMKCEFYLWNRVEGIRKYEENKISLEDEDKISGIEAIEFFKEEILNEDKDAIFFLEDLHPDLKEENAIFLKSLNLISDSLSQEQINRNNKKQMIVFTQPYFRLAKELESNVITLDGELPRIREVEKIFENIISINEIPESKINERAKERLFNSLLGLSSNEIFITLNKVYTKLGKFSELGISMINEEKGKIIKKNGHLEYFHNENEFDSVGGLDNLKKWLEKRQKGFSSIAKDYGLKPPKGILLLGVPGTGKSLAAKAIASQWELPLLKLDLGKIYGGIVGESEGNIRKALQTAEAMSPSILWIDEIEKGLSGSKSSGATDGGTSSRVLGTILTWMQEKKKPVFIVATANDITQLPPELLRKGRFDEIFFVDLPNRSEREEIFKIHLDKVGMDLKDYDREKLLDVSLGYSGSEIEAAVNEAMYASFYKEEQLLEEELIDALKETYPLSKIMSETILDLRKWSTYRARKASSGKSDFTPKIEKNSNARVKQEVINIFEN